MANEVIVAKILLPCSCSAIESAAISAGHQGHHHDAVIKLSEEGEKKYLIVSYQKE